MSFWERVGETLGYGVAAIVLGPIDAITRHERRAMRKSFVAWTRAWNPVPMTSSKVGFLRRSLTFVTRAGDVPAIAELDVFARRARIVASIGVLPSWVDVTLGRGSLVDVHTPRGTPLAIAGSLRAESNTLDVESARALLANVERGGLGALTDVEIEVRTKELTVRTIAMTTEAAWRAIGDAIVSLAELLAEKWPPSYRS
jgi:hypothetical protein